MPGSPKWDMHAHTGIYRVHPYFHVSLFEMILNPSTGNVSPQYHVIFGEKVVCLIHMGSLNPTKFVRLSSENLA